MFPTTPWLLRHSGDLLPLELLLHFGAVRRSADQNHVARQDTFPRAGPCKQHLAGFRLRGAHFDAQTFWEFVGDGDLAAGVKHDANQRAAWLVVGDNHT